MLFSPINLHHKSREGLPGRVKDPWGDWVDNWKGIKWRLTQIWQLGGSTVWIPRTFPTSCLLCTLTQLARSWEEWPSAGFLMLPVAQVAWGKMVVEVLECYSWVQWSCLGLSYGIQVGEITWLASLTSFMIPELENSHTHTHTHTHTSLPWRTGSAPRWYLLIRPLTNPWVGFDLCVFPVWNASRNPVSIVIL
jgi:hypothetical protein